MSVPDGFFIIADSAFPGDKSLKGKLVKAVSPSAMEKIWDRNEYARQHRINQVITKVRQAAEWEMRTV